MERVSFDVPVRKSADTRISFDEPFGRMSIEERRGDAKLSFEYARRGRQSADIARAKPVSGRPSFDLKGRLSLDPELITRSSLGASAYSAPKAPSKALEGCVIGFHGSLAQPIQRLQKLATGLGAKIAEVTDAGFGKGCTHLVTSDACAANPDDQVVRSAVRHGLWVVKEEWLVQSAEDRFRKEEDGYFFETIEHQARFEDLIHAATTKKTTLADLEQIERFYQEEVNTKALYRDLSKREGMRVLKLLSSLMGEKTESTIRPHLTDVAKKAFAMFFLFVQRDRGFQKAVEQLGVGQLARVLKIERHLEDPDMVHQELAVKLVVFLSTNYKRFEDLKLHLKSDVARQSVDARRNQVEIPSAPSGLVELNKEGHLPPEGRYYDMTAEAVAALFRTDFEKGLSAEEVQIRTDKYGPNTLPQVPPPPWWKILLLQFVDFLMIVLMVAGGVSYGLQKWIEGSVLFAVVIANALIGFYQELKAEKQLEALKNMLVQTATVLRGGAREDVPADQLVPGDIVILQEGAQVPADMRLFEAQSLRVLEAQLTGENEPIKKVTKPLLESGLKEGDQVNMAFMSTNVTVGDGKGIVVATGVKTAIGQISKNVSSAQPGPTKLQQKLKKLGILLLILAVVLCSIILAMSFIWMAGRGLCTPLCPGPQSLDAVTTAVALAVSVIPEGLLAIFTICMAMGASRMAERGAIVRRLASVETLGSVTTICSDKTGTLTLGQMKQEVLWVPKDREYFISGEGIEPVGEFIGVADNSRMDKDHLSESVRQCMLVQSLCNGSSIFQDETSKKWRYTGDPTEVALLVAAYKVNMSQPQLLEQGWKIIGRAPFDSNRKRMTILAEHPTAIPQGRATVLSKGAPEAVLKICTGILLLTGEVAPITDELLAIIDQQSGAMADNGLRVLGLAYSFLQEKDMTTFNAEDDNTIQFEQNLIFCGLAGLLDPPRAPVKKAVAVCHGAGIRVVMITGDHPRTALAIAKRLGIAESTMSERQVLKGKELDALSMEELAAMEPFPTVFARVSPEDKMKIVHALQSRDEVVSMTGDGVNDAPAIRHADVGVAMGITGTDLTKEAADIVLTDDNFNSIVQAVAEGRRIMDNIILFLVYLLSCNSGEIWTMLACVAGGLPSPFSGLQILWGNLIIDSPPSLALGVQPAANNVLTRLPRNPDQGIFTMTTASLLLLQGISLACLSVTVFVVDFVGFGYSVLDPNSSIYQQGLIHAQAHTFITISCMQVSQSLSGRSLTKSLFRMNVYDNPWLLLGMTISLSLLIACMYIPGWNEVFDQYPMDGYDWIITFSMVVVHLSVVELIKFVLRHNCFLKQRAPLPNDKQWYKG